MRTLPALSRLRAFEAAARRQSFALAAEELHLTASAISHQVRALETDLGRPLFERRHRRVELTPEGERLQRDLAQAFDAMEAACAQTRLPALDPALSVHCAPSLAIKWLGPRLRDFTETHPGVPLRLSTGADVPDLAAVRDVDLVLAYNDARERPGVEAAPLGSETLAPLAAPSLLRRIGTLALPSPGSATSKASTASRRTPSRDRGQAPERASRKASGRARGQIHGQMPGRVQGRIHGQMQGQPEAPDWATWMQRLPLIDSTLSPVSWPRWFELQGLPMPQSPRTAFDRAAMAIAAAVDGLGMALESTRLAARELERGELLIVGAGVFRPVRQPVHFLLRRPGQPRPAVRAFVTWLLEQAALDAPAA